jgi:hypothetical protein
MGSLFRRSRYILSSGEIHSAGNLTRFAPRPSMPSMTPLEALTTPVDFLQTRFSAVPYADTLTAEQ